MLEKSVSSGNSDPIFTNWHQRVGKKTTQASPKLFKQNRQRMRKRYKSLMHGLNYANKAGHGCCRKSTKSIRLSARNVREQCQLLRLSRIPRSLPRLLTGQSSRTGSKQRLSVLVPLQNRYWCRDNTPKRSLYGTE